MSLLKIDIWQILGNCVILNILINLIQINNVVGLTVNKAKEAWTNGLREKL